MPLELWQHENGFWHIRGTVTVWRNGQSHSHEVRKSTKCRDKLEADAIRRQIEGAVSERNITNREPAQTFNEASNRYVKQGGEERFLAKPRAHLGRLRIDQITQQIIDDEGFKAYPASSATRRRQFHAPVIAVLRSNGIRQSFDRPPDGQKRTLFLRPEQAVAAIAKISDTRYPNPWSPALATFLFGQGSRVSETLAIDGKHDISLPDRYAIFRIPKNGIERMVPLCRRTIAALTTLPNLGQPGPLFLRYDGRPYETRESRGYKFKFWDRAMTEIGLDPHRYTPHVARHSWATWHYSQNKDVVRLKAEGGWESNEWQRYVKLANPAIAKAAIAAGFDFRENTPETDFAGILRA